MMTLASDQEEEVALHLQVDVADFQVDVADSEQLGVW